MYVILILFFLCLQKNKMAKKLLSVRVSDEVDELLKKIAEKIEKGESIQKSIGRSVFFNREYKSFLVIGEKIGRLSDSFENLSSLYYEKISQRTKTLLKLLEPLSILFIGFIIGIIIFAVMLPIFKMGEFL